MHSILAPRDVLALVEAQTPPGFVRAAVFDADGTLWRGDIGDTAFLAAARAGLLSDDTFHGPLAAWAREVGITLPADKHAAVAHIVHEAESGALALTFVERGLDGDAWRSSLYEMQAWVYADQPPAVLARFADELFAGGFGTEIFPSMRALLDDLRRAQVDVFIASASHRALVLAGAPALGVPAERVLGMDPAPRTAGELPRIRTSTYGPHKARAAHARIGGAPLLAFGDSVLFTDRALLDSAHLPFAVATRGAHREAALAHPRMRLVDP